MRLGSWSLFAVVAASGCASARWSVAEPRPVAGISVAAAELTGVANPFVVEARRHELMAALRLRGYQVFDGGAATAGVPCLTIRFDGTAIDDSQMHAPDDQRHNIYNDLHYSFVAYTVNVSLRDAGGHVVAAGSAQADRDPAKAIDGLTARIMRDLPPSLAGPTPPKAPASAIASR